MKLNPVNLYQRYFFFCAQLIWLIEKDFRPKSTQKKVHYRNTKKELLSQRIGFFIKVARNVRKNDFDESRGNFLDTTHDSLNFLNLHVMLIARMSVRLSEDILREVISRVAALMRASLRPPVVICCSLGCLILPPLNWIRIRWRSMRGQLVASPCSKQHVVQLLFEPGLSTI